MPLNILLYAVMLLYSVSFMLSVNYAENQKLALYAQCRYAECHYAKCHYAECHYVECLGAVNNNSTIMNSMTNFINALGSDLSYSDQGSLTDGEGTVRLTSLY
jgi:hypothetical protein